MAKNHWPCLLLFKFFFSCFSVKKDDVFWIIGDRTNGCKAACRDSSSLCVDIIEFSEFINVNFVKSIDLKTCQYQNFELTFPASNVISHDWMVEYNLDNCRGFSSTKNSTILCPCNAFICPNHNIPINSNAFESPARKHSGNE